MEICVVHGSNRRGNTEIMIGIIKDTLNTLGDISYSDIYLPKDLPHFCDGCFACLTTGECGGQNCPHKQYTHTILEKMLKSDGIIFASPSYALAETGQIKAFFDHFACIYISHRPYEEMFDKVVFVVSSAAALGTGRTVSTISRNLLFWGIKRIVKCRVNIWEKDWKNMTDKNRSKMEKRLKSKTCKFYKFVKNRYNMSSGLLNKTLRYMFKRMIRNYPDTQPDKIYWKSKGWI